ncbi:pilin [Halomonas sp. MES3-P3E]|uniref:pilin n=1 Tax=Halomonas sp. MES3-P3E TaxID=2058321 RepID=UPI000C34F19D|nr:pilin [Halomonas sp. MES3-P3E]PKG48999.1 prepilin-type cleavage/methylation domain-containing protein [Halomonas sp. MES3-P3E]
MQKSAQPNTRSTKQGGFTLIELMIVVAIIGVLASIAVPQYQNYTARAQASEGVTATGGVRTDIAEQYSMRNKLPTYEEMGTATTGDSTGDLDISGRYIESVAYGGGNTGAIEITFTQNSALNGAQMNLLPDDENPSNGWICEWDSADAEDSWLPAGCRRE